MTWDDIGGTYVQVNTLNSLISKSYILFFFFKFLESNKYETAKIQEEIKCRKDALVDMIMELPSPKIVSFEFKLLIHFHI